MSDPATPPATTSQSEPAPMGGVPAATPAKAEPAPLLTPEPKPEKMPGDALDASKAPAKPAEKPVEYKFENVPEGYDTKEVEAFAREHGLSPKAAQKVMDRDFALAQRIMDNQKAAFEGEQKKWVDKVMKDPVLGGENLEKTRMQVNNAWMLVPKEVRAELSDAGYLNHPALISILQSFGSRLGEDRMPDKEVKAPTSRGSVGLQALFEEIHGKT